MADFDVGRVLSRTFALARAGIGSIGPVVVGLVVIQSLIGHEISIRTHALFLTARASGDPMAALAIFGSGWYWANFLVSIAISCAAAAVAIYGFLQIADGKPVTSGQCLGAGLRNLGPIFVLSILTTLGVGLGTILFVIPGLILFAMWSVAVPALIDERPGIIGSLGRSRALTKGSRFKILLVIALFWLAIIVIQMVSVRALYGASLGTIGALSTRVSYIPFNTVWTSGFLFMVDALLTSIYIETSSSTEGGRLQYLNQVFQ